MKRKPADRHAVEVYSIRPQGAFYSVEWTDGINYPRTHKTLFHGSPGNWQSGEKHPTGVYGAPLRGAHPTIAAALDKFVAAQPDVPAFVEHLLSER